MRVEGSSGQLPVQELLNSLSPFATQAVGTGADGQLLFGQQRTPPTVCVEMIVVAPARLVEVLAVAKMQFVPCEHPHGASTIQSVWYRGL